MAEFSGPATSVSWNSSFQQQLTICIQGLEALRASGGAAIPPDVRDVLSGILSSQELSHCVLSSSQPHQSVVAPQISVSESAPAMNVISVGGNWSVASNADITTSSTATANSSAAPRRESYADKVKYARGFSPPPLCGIEMGKFGSCEGLRQYPSGDITHFEEGLLRRIGMPHLEFLKAMRSEHCEETGCNLSFTTRNYGISTCPKKEWDIVVCGTAPRPEHMMHGRVLPNIEQKMISDVAIKARLRREEVIAVVLYTGPMYVIYNAILSRFADTLFDDGQSVWGTLNGQTGLARNVFATTLNVLVSAVQKLRMVTVYSENLLLYRGTGGKVNLPEHFFRPDDLGCKGMTDWGFFSATTDINIARNYSGAPKGSPNPIVFEIQTNCVDHGASVSEFSQYPQENEFIFVP
jgi:hypothetical protein